MNKRIIITGATSMIGIAIIHEYLKHDTEAIYAVIRPKSSNAYRIPNDKRIQILELDTVGYSRLSSMIKEKCDVFYHLAWDGTGVNREKSTIGQASNIVNTLEALRAAKEIGCRSFVGAGSQAEYGLLDIERINEDCDTRPIIPYGIAKLAAGQLAIAESKKIGINCFWVRVFSVYGIYDKPSSMISNAIQRLNKGEKMSFTPALQRWDYLNSIDAGRAFYLIGEKSEGQKIYNLGSGQARQLKEFIYIIRDIVNPKAELGIGDIPYRGSEVMNICADITRLSLDTGWKPTISFEDGITELVKNLQ